MIGGGDVHHNTLEVTMGTLRSILLGYLRIALGPWSVKTLFGEDPYIDQARKNKTR